MKKMLLPIALLAAAVGTALVAARVFLPDAPPGEAARQAVERGKGETPPPSPPPAVPGEREPISRPAPSSAGGSTRVETPATPPPGGATSTPPPPPTPPPPASRGRIVVADPVAARGATVRIDPESTGAPIEAPLDADGVLALPDLAPGRHLITIREAAPASEARSRVGRFTVSADVPLDIRIDDRTPRGSVRGDAGATAAGANVNVQSTAPDPQGFRYLATTRAAADGTFALAGLPPGRYSVRAVFQAEGGARRASGEVVVEPGVDARVELKPEP